MAKLGALPFRQGLRLGWPATERETGPEPKMAGEMAGSQFLGGGFQHGRKMAGQLKFGDFLSIRPLAQQFFGHSGTPEMAGHFAGHFSATFGSGPVCHSVAGQPSRKARLINVHFRKDVLGCRASRFKALRGTRSRFLGRVDDEALFSEKMGFSVKSGETFSE